MSNTLALTTQNDLAVMPVLDISQAKQRRDAIVQFVSAIMVEGVDFGTIPGTNDKNVLLKPGAEKLTTFFGLSKQFEIMERVERWEGDEPFFYYLYRCRLYRGDLLIAEGDGSCNSHESKYRWRWVEINDVPQSLNPDSLMSRKSSLSEFVFAINKREATGRYGKPVEYWDEFEAAIASGDARKTTRKTSSGKEFEAWEIDSTSYRVPNPDIASQVNTIQKMAQKRALIAATLLAVNASEFFTQDLEDFEVGEIVDAEVAPAPAPPPAPPAKPKRQPRANGNGQKTSNGNATTAFWAYQRENDIDKQAALDVLAECGQDFAAALEALKKMDKLLFEEEITEDELPFS